MSTFFNTRARPRFPRFDSSSPTFTLPPTLTRSLNILTDTSSAGRRQGELRRGGGPARADTHAPTRRNCSRTHQPPSDGSTRVTHCVIESSFADDGRRTRASDRSATGSSPSMRTMEYDLPAPVRPHSPTTSLRLRIAVSSSVRGRKSFSATLAFVFLLPSTVFAMKFCIFRISLSAYALCSRASSLRHRTARTGFSSSPNASRAPRFMPAAPQS